jgi:hypothetical protein
MMGALAAVETGLAPGFTETLLECGLVLCGFGAMTVWARRNRVALDYQDWCGCASTRVTMRVIPSRQPELSRAERVPEMTPVELEEVAR